MKQILLSILMIAASFGTTTAQQPVSALNGNWKLVSASGNLIKRLPDGQVPELRFETGANAISGFAGCNQISGQFKTEADMLTIGPLILTKKACENMELEMILERFLTSVGAYKVDRDSLYLYDKSDRTKYLLFNRITGTI